MCICIQTYTHYIYYMCVCMYYVWYIYTLCIYMIHIYVFEGRHMYRCIGIRTCIYLVMDSVSVPPSANVMVLWSEAFVDDQVMTRETSWMGFVFLGKRPQRISHICHHVRTQREEGSRCSRKKTLAKPQICDTSMLNSRSPELREINPIDCLSVYGTFVPATI